MNAGEPQKQITAKTRRARSCAKSDWYFFAQLRVFAVNLSTNALEDQFPSMLASIIAPSVKSEIGMRLP
jgi:hypothetical protein